MQSKDQDESKSEEKNSGTQEPYCFLYNNTPVQIEYAPDSKSLEEKLTDFFIELKNR